MWWAVAGAGKLFASVGSATSVAAAGALVARDETGGPERIPPAEMEADGLPESAFELPQPAIARQTRPQHSRSRGREAETMYLRLAWASAPGAR